MRSKNLVLAIFFLYATVAMSRENIFPHSFLNNHLNEDDIITSFKKNKNKSKKEISSANSNLHAVKVHSNKVNYIVARTGDTYLEIAKEFGMGLWQLYKYNNYSSIKDHLSEGDIVYLQPKRKYSRTVKQVVLSENKTLAEISQEEAVKIESLIQMNKSISSENQVLPKGSKVTLH